jgi:hypothetical protein
MKTYSTKFVFLLACVLFATTSFSVRNQQGQMRKASSTEEELPKILPAHSARPLVALFNEPAPRDPREQERRQSRDRLTNDNSGHVILDPGTREVDGQAESLAPSFVDGVTILKPGERADPDGLPINGCTIVIGTVTSGHAYVNQAHTGVFSEYNVTVKEVLQRDADSVISGEDQLTVWRTGGSLQFASGHVRHFITVGRGFPEIGAQYLFFLRRPDKTVQDYAISTAYSIKDKEVAPLDGMNYPRSPYEAMAVNDFISKLRQEIRSRQ